MTFKEFWAKAKDVILAILAAIGGFILLILGIRKGKANKQIKKNEEVISDIEKEKESIKEEIKDIDSTVSEAKKVVEKAEDSKHESQKTADKIDSQIDKNKSILEKYK